MASLIPWLNDSELVIGKDGECCPKPVHVISNVLLADLTPTMVLPVAKKAGHILLCERSNTLSGKYDAPILANLNFLEAHG